MDNFRFNMTCEGKETLEAAMALVWRAKGYDAPRPHARPDYKKPGVTHYAIRPAFAGERQPVPEGAPLFFTPDWQYGKKPRPLRLVFYDCTYTTKLLSDDQIALPFTLDAAGAGDFATRWLAECDYGKQLDHDGDNHKGWRLYNESWGHVDGHYTAVIAVAPEWIMYGK